MAAWIEVISNIGGQPKLIYGNGYVAAIPEEVLHSPFPIDFGPVPAAAEVGEHQVLVVGLRREPVREGDGASRRAEPEGVVGVEGRRRRAHPRRAERKAVGRVYVDAHRDYLHRIIVKDRGMSDDLTSENCCLESSTALPLLQWRCIRQHPHGFFARDNK